MEPRPHTKEELEEEAMRLARELRPKEGGATIVALSGDLGSGKTTFTQSLARALGVSASITSPTFVIEKRYALEGQPFDALVHIDAYRLDTAEDLAKLAFKETAANPKNLIVIEWAEKVANLLPEDAIRISLTFLDEHTRTLSYHGH